ncbi:MAG: TIGR03790 family protein [Planctomycetota bacterium]
MKLTRWHKVIIAVLLSLPFGGELRALEPNEILVVVNADSSSSLELGRYYCHQRGVPEENILKLSLGKTLADSISRDEYDKLIAGPIYRRLTELKPGQTIRCLLTTYGVPYKVGPRGPLKDQQQQLKQLEASALRYEKKLTDITADAESAGEQSRIKKELARVQGQIDRILGRETQSSVDSELSMVLFGTYELYRWQPNQLEKNSRYPEELVLTIMVCRLDGPSPQTARGLVDKAITAEKTGLHGTAYIDSRGIADDKQPYSIAHFDQSLRDLAMLLRLRTNLKVVEERTEKLFEPGSCPQTAIYCGWYSLKNYVDAFDFVEGAIGFHVASFEAADLRDPNSPQWCPAMLVDGITATLGAVNEPYLHAFPNPADFFSELLNGYCLVEAFYRTQPFCSWQMVLIGDPLYTPFKKPRTVGAGEWRLLQQRR